MRIVIILRAQKTISPQCFIALLHVLYRAFVSSFFGLKLKHMLEHSQTIATYTEVM